MQEGGTGDRGRDTMCRVGGEWWSHVARHKHNMLYTTLLYKARQMSESQWDPEASLQLTQLTSKSIPRYQRPPHLQLLPECILCCHCCSELLSCSRRLPCRRLPPGVRIGCRLLQPHTLLPGRLQLLRTNLHLHKHVWTNRHHAHALFTPVATKLTKSLAHTEKSTSYLCSFEARTVMPAVH